uniref:Uncharacterized protein n=1 Tax=Arundo donax TaxID=35708 RepID=A0A0A9CEQ4_ARUDO
MYISQFNIYFLLDIFVRLLLHILLSVSNFCDCQTVCLCLFWTCIILYCVC